uniref:Immunoglobulin domain-containing protein n=1 Tax=Poecilia formosa TaxID=48698 RepID=A0A087X759_POEFO
NKMLYYLNDVNFLVFQPALIFFTVGDLTRWTGKERENITVGCKFLFSGRIKFFCKGICEGENILVETSEDTAQSGRYNIEYKTYDSGSYVLYVSISKLKRSDAGQYRCGLDNPGVRYDDFKLIVTEDLQDGDSVRTIRGIEGTTITFGCKFIFPGSTKFFCKEICEGENILIETTEDRAQRGRYSIEYEKHRSESIAVYVSISELKRSDSGRYRCGLDKSWTRYDDFDLDVTGASNTSGPNWTLKTFPSTLVTSSSLTLTQRLSSSSSSSSYETTQQTRTSPEPKGLLLYVFLSL